MKPDAPAIRIRGLGCYFGPRLEMDGANHPREAWRTLLRLAGMDLPQSSDETTQRTSVVGGYGLRDVSLDIAAGSVVCLAGPAGAGKSVLLQILAGAMAPTSGRAEIFGSLSSLVGGGDLDEQSSAEDNIRASAEFEATPVGDRAHFVAEVIDFAEIHGFQTAPLRTFSTGMRLRLSIALVLCSRSSILLLDAMMSVGDIAFQQKCVERVRELAEQGRTIVAVFDDDAVVQQLATRVVTMAGGRIVSDTSPASYARHVTSGAAADVSWEVTSDLPEDDAVVMRALTVDAARNGGSSSLDLTMAFEARLDGVRCRPSVVLNWGELRLFRTPAPQSLTLERGRRVTWTVRIPTDPLAAGAYTLMVNMQSEHGEAVYSMKAHEAVSLSVSRASGEARDANPRMAPLLTVQFPWEIETVESGGAA
jgi:ABC-type polysaccharide/polyol phosphate transport system ATPase subunit